MQKNKLVLFLASLFILSSLSYILTKSVQNPTPTEVKNNFLVTNQKIINNKDQVDMDVKYVDNTNTVQWLNSLFHINSNLQLNRDRKIIELSNLLEKNKNDPIAVREIMVNLGQLNPVEVIEEILPFLNHEDESVQIATIGALNNAMILTDSELIQKRFISKNDTQRKKIAPAIRNLLQNPQLSSNTQDVILSCYATTNPSIEDTHNMVQSLMNSSSISHNTAGYLASTVLNGKEIDNIIKLLNQKNTEDKNEVLTAINVNIVANPLTLELLDFTAKKKLYDFIIKNPPLDQNGFSLNQSDEWKMALNTLQQSLSLASHR